MLWLAGTDCDHDVEKCYRRTEPPLLCIHLEQNLESNL